MRRRESIPRNRTARSIRAPCARGCERATAGGAGGDQLGSRETIAAAPQARLCSRPRKPMCRRTVGKPDQIIDSDKSATLLLSGLICM